MFNIKFWRDFNANIQYSQHAILIQIQKFKKISSSSYPTHFFMKWKYFFSDFLHHSHCSPRPPYCASWRCLHSQTSPAGPELSAAIWTAACKWSWWKWKWKYSESLMKVKVYNMVWLLASCDADGFYIRLSCRIITFCWWESQIYEEAGFPRVENTLHCLRFTAIRILEEESLECE